MTIRKVSDLRRVAAFMLWVHLSILSWQFWPIAAGADRALTLSSDLAIDQLSAMFILLTAFASACAITHADVLFSREEKDDGAPSPLSMRFAYACFSIFILAMSMVYVSMNLGYLWIAIEATTLSSAPLVYLSRTKHALEATWKYLIICSVGIAFALFGTILIFASSQHGAPSGGTLCIAKLIAHAPLLHQGLLKLGFIFCFLGYGTKSGMFPLHSWLPDAHAEAPAPASAMLSGCLLNCALFGIWRVCQIVLASKQAAGIQSLIVWAGVTTAIAAAVFLVRQHGFKRLWAYSSIENVGIMLVAIGLGSGMLFFWQALNHSLAKISLFLLSGNVVVSAKTKHISDIKGILKISPVWALLLCLSAFAVTGAPPFGTFVSEWLILTECALSRQWAVVAGLFTALALSFIAVCIHLGRVLFGQPREGVVAFSPLASSAVPALLVICSFILGFTYISAPGSCRSPSARQDAALRKAPRFPSLRYCSAGPYISAPGSCRSLSARQDAALRTALSPPSATLCFFISAPGSCRSPSARQDAALRKAPRFPSYKRSARCVPCSLRATRRSASGGSIAALRFASFHISAPALSYLSELPKQNAGR